MRDGAKKPRDLAKAVGLSLFALRQRIKPLVKAGQVVTTGATMNRLIALPGRSAKEDL